MKILFSTLFCLLISVGSAQNDSLNIQEFNPAATSNTNPTSKFKFGGYGQVDYNQPIENNTKSNGKLDVHRVVLFLGYSFSPKWELVTEIELEHVKEVFVEQAYITYKMNKYFNLKGGLLLIPMGYINEYHEPPVYFGVERPLLDSKVVPTTWREMGFGAYGRIPELSLKYQLYLVNGFNGYKGSAKFDGDDAYRGGRQKGAESIITYPNLSTKIDFNGIKRLKLGLSGYFGKSQSSLFSHLSNTNQEEIMRADSSVISISMLGLDALYQYRGLQLKGQAIYSFNKNVEQYNQFGNADLGKEIFGYYLEAAYNLLATKDTDCRLSPFVRYENFDTQYALSPGTVKNPESHRKVVVAGLSYYPTPELVLKADMQWIKTDSSSDSKKSLNIGFGFMF